MLKIGNLLRYFPTHQSISIKGNILLIKFDNKSHTQNLKNLKKKNPESSNLTITDSTVIYHKNQTNEIVRVPFIRGGYSELLRSSLLLFGVKFLFCSLGFIP